MYSTGNTLPSPLSLVPSLPLSLFAAGIPCPMPLLLRLHVLVMEFIGEPQSHALHPQVPTKLGLPCATSDFNGFSEPPASFSSPSVLLSSSGSDGWAAPRLKDVPMTEARASDCYLQVSDWDWSVKDSGCTAPKMVFFASSMVLYTSSVSNAPYLLLFPVRVCAPLPLSSGGPCHAAHVPALPSRPR